MTELGLDEVGAERIRLDALDDVVAITPPQPVHEQQDGDEQVEREEHEGQRSTRCGDTHPPDPIGSGVVERDRVHGELVLVAELLDQAQMYVAVGVGPHGLVVEDGNTHVISSRPRRGRAVVPKALPLLEGTLLVEPRP